MISDFEKKTFGHKNFEYSIRSSLVKDLQKYKLGVHTDTVHKFVTFLFYIPKDNSNSNLGTTLYKPKKGAEINIDLTFTFLQNQYGINLSAKNV